MSEKQTVSLKPRQSVPGALPAGAPGAGKDAACDPLEGYRFVHCLRTTPTVETWDALTEAGQPCRVKFIHGVDAARISPGADPLGRLRALDHEAVLPAAYAWCGPYRVAVVQDPAAEPLVNRLKHYQAEGQPGLPRTELLGYLRTAAEALDALLRVARVQHLSLNPWNLVVREGRLLLTELGFVELLWLPAGQALAAANPRYAAPELLQEQRYRSSDQYSLALIFLEMLTGEPAGRPGKASRAGRDLDLGGLSARDRVILQRALQPHPARRFGSNLELVHALESSAQALLVENQPAADRGGEAPSETDSGTPLITNPAAVRQVLDHVTVRSGIGEVREAGSVRYVLRPDQGLGHRFQTFLSPESALAKLAQLCRDLRARVLVHVDWHFEFEVSLPGSLWQHLRGKVPGLKVALDLPTPPESPCPVTEVLVSIRPLHCDGPLAVQLLHEFGPRLLDGLRNYLSARSERRREERLPFVEEVLVRPALFRGRGIPTVPSQARDISLRGMRLVLPCKLCSDQIYLQLPSTAEDRRLLVPARVVRTRPALQGGYDLGVHFLFSEALPEQPPVIEL